MPTVTITSNEIDTWADEPAEGLSAEANAILSGSDSDEGIAVLIKISGNGITPIYVSSTAIEFLGFEEQTLEPVHGITFEDIQWVYAPYSITFVSTKDDGKLAGARVQIANVNPEIVKYLRNNVIAFDISMTCIFKYSKEVLQRSPNLKLMNATITSATIEGEIGDYEIMMEPIPPMKYNPSTTRGLHGV